MTSVLDDYTDDQKRKTIPDFLIVLAVLTFVGSIVCFMRAWFVFTHNLSLGPMRDGTSMGKIVIVYSVVQFACIFMAIIGAISMLRLRKLGFRLYLIFNAIYIIQFVVFHFKYNEIPFSNGQLITVLMYAGLPLGFTIMYALNQKHLD